MRKGQAAMEFLMTYGWAILVVLVAIGALAYFGVLNPSRFLPKSCTLAPGMGCDEFQIEDDTTDDDLQILLRNGMGDDLTDVHVTASSATGGVCSLDAAATCCGDTWAAGEVLGGASGLTLADCGDLGSAGARAKMDIVIYYNVSTSPIRHAVNGSLTTQVENLL